jgi:predicted LPLAT superfamily acyltransferase
LHDDRPGGRIVTRIWLERPEGGSAWALRLFTAVAFGLGRSVSRLVLLPITVYFLLRRAPERRASRAYLTRVLGRPPTWLEVARHFHTFAGVTLDRVYFLSQSPRYFDTRMIGIEQLHRAMDLGRGVLLIGAHVGSFDALRAMSTLRPDVTVRVVLDAEHSPVLSAILRQLNPRIAAGIINPRQDGTTVALEIGAALNDGSLVTMLGDRGRPGNAAVSVEFLGSPAEFPTAPWQIAAALRVPVVLCAGLYRGGRRYDLHFELIAEQLRVERHRREQQLRTLVQDYADRLAALLRLAPYNWFNFYDFWNEPATGDRRVDAGDGHAARS